MNANFEIILDVKCKMVSNIEIFYITCGSVSCFILFIVLIRHYKNYGREKNEKNRILNVRRKLMISHRIKPIIQMTDEELKDEFEQYEIRTSQVTAEENV